MERINKDNLKKIQLQILDVVAKFCDRNDINYFLDSGTLIGAVRHKGYIPWDDDIDIGMLRNDYDKFLSLFNEINDKYKVYSIDNNDSFLYPIAKVIDTDTVLYEQGQILGVNIDVFVYDNAPDDNIILNKMYDIRDRLRFWHRQRAYDYTHRGNIIRRFAILPIKLLLKIFPKNYFVKQFSANAQKYKNYNTKRVGYFMGRVRIAVDKSAFSSFIFTDFEGKSYKIPTGYDMLLRAMYGDYMQLPPKEERIPSHDIEAYYKII